MKRKGIYLLAVLMMIGVGAAHAQSMSTQAGATESNQMFDGRWYIAPTLGFHYNDSDRLTDSYQYYWSVGVGKFVNPHLSIEGFIDHTKRDRDARFPDETWSTLGLGISARYFPGDFETWKPYLMLGVLGARYHVGVANGDWVPAIQAGIGTQAKLWESTALRFELAYRYDHNDNTFPRHNGYGDYLLGVSLISYFGEPPAPPEPVAPPPPEPEPQPNPAQLDSDGDGVNNAMDECPNTEPGTIVGPDGCAKTVIIDLQGVNFKFDRPQPGETDIAPTLQEPQMGTSILDQAIDTLKRYPAVKVKLTGYTDYIGTKAYNQKLSERRAQIVYHYLTHHGLDPDRIVGIKGYGESHPIATAHTAAARARNRRTELHVQNPEQPVTKANRQR